ncbi:methyltransferase-like protein 27 isoform X3 [Perognathus longimembris pacificus]|uniref:methyltransferase-like protein 27 isoform X3 n=1 Tax=Perognathus longimembris pacificus TaxID=214514 RepID=UPI002019381D|nr:methyltransferase-like protein 27 isoform X3 [Perognathus longimembris pacificus]
MPGAAVTPRMAPEEVRARVEAAHGLTDPAQKLCFYDRWARDYDQDVAALQYQAPRLAVDCLINTCPGLDLQSLILDVACGTGLVASELQARGFLQLHGVDGSPEMLKQAQARGLYQKLSLCTLGQEPLPSPEGTFDVVLIVGALSHGQVPCTVIPELLRVTKPALMWLRLHMSGQALSSGSPRGHHMLACSAGLWEEKEAFGSKGLEIPTGPSPKHVIGRPLSQPEPWPPAHMGWVS